MANILYNDEHANQAAPNLKVTEFKSGIMGANTLNMGHQVKATEFVPSVGLEGFHNPDTMVSDIDFAPSYMPRRVKETVVLKSKPAIRVIVSNLHDGGNRLISDILDKAPAEVVGKLQEHCSGNSDCNYNFMDTYEKHKLFRHFIAMLAKGMIGCNGAFNKDTNRVYIIQKGDDDSGVMSVKGVKIYRGVPAIDDFSKENIDNVGESLTDSITASENGSYYDKLVKDSGYISPKAQRVMAAEKHIVGITTGKTDLEIANMVIASNRPTETMSVVAKELPVGRTQNIIRMVRQNG